MRRKGCTKMKINTLNYFFADAFKSLKRNKTISIASIITVLITFVVLGVFSLTAENAKVAIVGVQDKMEVNVYLDDEIKLVDQREVQIKLKNIDGVESVEYESKEDAYNKVKDSSDGNNSLLNGYSLEKNPFPASFVCKIKDSSVIDKIDKAVKDMSGVEEVKSQSNIINNIEKAIKGVKTFGYVIFAILIAVSIFLIMNTTKLTVFSRRREVGIMKFVGATDWFIRWPFIIEGIVIGLIGAILSTVVLFGIYKVVFNVLASNMLVVTLIKPSYIFTNLLAKFSLAGIGVGGVASYAALRKFLIV